MNNGENKIRYEIERLVATNTPEKLSKGCICLTDTAEFKYFVFDDGTIVEQDCMGMIRSITPSVRYKGIVLKKVEKNDAGNTRDVYSIELVREYDRYRWFLLSLSERVADGQITEELAHKLKYETFTGTAVSNQLRYLAYAGHINGYLYQSIRLTNGLVRPVPVHMIIQSLFNGFASYDDKLIKFMRDHNINENFLIVNHKNSFKLDNDADNLEWVTSKLNAMHGSFMNSGCCIQLYEGEDIGFKFVEFCNRGGNKTGKYSVCNKRVSAFDVYGIVKNNYKLLTAS